MFASCRIVTAVASVWVFCCAALAQSSAPPAQERLTGQISFGRKIVVPFKQGQSMCVLFPRVVSFWGATNEQIIDSVSELTISVKPDQAEPLIQDSPTPFRGLKLIWKSPKVDRVEISERYVLEMNRCIVLRTAAKLPYPAAVAKQLASSLAATNQIVLDDPQLEPICKDISSKAQWAEEAISQACDWVQENLKGTDDEPTASNVTLKNGKGDYDSRTCVACAILRKLGIPAEPVQVYHKDDGNRTHLEAYLPDAGWVFYDACSPLRGSHNVSYMVGVDEPALVGPVGSELTRQGCSPTEVCYSWGEFPRYKLSVMHQKPLSSARIRHLPISRLMTDKTIPSGKRRFTIDGVREVVQGPAPPDRLGKPEDKPGSAAGKEGEPEPRPAADTEKPAPKTGDNSSKGDSEPGKTADGPKTSAGPEARKLRLAQTYLSSGLKDKARALLQEIVDKHPDTPSATTARTLLKEMDQ